MKQQRILQVLLIIVVSLSSRGVSRAQHPDRTVVRRPTSTSFNLLVGVTVPQGRESLRQYWLSGPGGSAEFFVHLNSVLSFGVGADLSLLYFDEAAFAQQWPGVQPNDRKNIFVGSVYVDGTLTPMPGRRTRPFLSLQIGSEFISEASYRVVVGGVRYTYYDVGGRPRLNLGVRGGAIIALSYNLGVLFELKGTFIHNDPDISFLAHGRAGVQYKF